MNFHFSTMVGMTANNILILRKTLRMKNPENQILAEFECRILTKSQEVIAQRPQKFTQSEMARRLCVSIKTIQNFETSRSVSAYLLFGYTKLLS